MLRSGAHLAETEEEKRAVYRFRYDIYVEEMGRYQGIADHENRMFMEPEDATARTFYVAEDGEVLATSRMSWGGDAPFTPRLIQHYMLEPFLAEMAPETLVVGERGMVVPRLRGSDVFRQLGRATKSFISENRIQLVFGACEPHLLSRYMGQGARTYSNRNINSPEAGYLIPIVTVIEDVEYLRSIGSPEAEFATDYGDDARVPACVDRLVTQGGNVMSQRLTALSSYWTEVDTALGELGDSEISALDGLTEEEAGRCLGRSNIIECNAGDRILKKGGVARNMFVVLEGHLEVRDGEKLLRVLGPGDVLGEVAFLLEMPRTADVFAATDSVRILSLSEGTIRKMIASDPTVAARLLLNISKILCLRILKTP